jgi:hypothetical protein
MCGCQLIPRANPNSRWLTPVARLRSELAHRPKWRLVDHAQVEDHGLPAILGGDKPGGLHQAFWRVRTELLSWEPCLFY